MRALQTDLTSGVRFPRSFPQVFRMTFCQNASLSIFLQRPCLVVIFDRRLPSPTTHLPQLHAHFRSFLFDPWPYFVFFFNISQQRYLIKLPSTITSFSRSLRTERGFIWCWDIQNFGMTDLWSSWKLSLFWALLTPQLASHGVSNVSLKGLRGCFPHCVGVPRADCKWSKFPRRPLLKIIMKKVQFWANSSSQFQWC